jgi:tetratricopeptide (TPR) repeat protein
VALHHLADAQVQLGDLEGALGSYRRSRSVAAGLAAEFPDNADYRGLVGTADFWIADVLAQLDRPAEALVIYRERLASGREEVRRDPKNAIARGGVSVTLIRVGDMELRLGRPRQALPYYREANTIGVEQFRADSGNLFKRMQLMESQVKICRALGAVEPAGAEAECSRATALMNGTVLEPSNAGYRGYLAGQYMDMGQAYDSLAIHRSVTKPYAQRFRVAALEMYRRSAGIWSDLHNRRLVNPTDTARVTAAVLAVARAEAAVTGGASGDGRSRR